MTPEAFAALLRLLGGNAKEAGENYEKIRRRLIRLFEWRGCEFPEEMTDETFNRVARRVAEGVKLEADDPYGYFCGVAHLVYKEVLRNAARKSALLEKWDWPPAASQDEESEDHRLESLRHCLHLLDRDQQSLLLRYHQGENNIRARRELCDELHIGMNALRIRVHRLRRRLETCIEEQMRG
jgi:DNA-directed RNA polymerase specialized sigma24 family protein